MIRFYRFIFALLLSVSLVFPATASVNIGFVTTENSERLDPTRMAYALDPGEVFTDSISLINGNDHELSLRIAAVDIVLLNGDTFFSDIADEQHYFGTWVDFEETVWVVPAYGQVEVPFTLSIPQDVGPGDYFGGFVLFEATSSEVLSSSNSSAVILSRIGLTIPVTVNGEASFDFTWDEEIEATYNKSTGAYQFSYTFDNAGNVSVEPEMTIELKNFGLWSLGTLKPTLSRVYSGGVSQVKVDWENPPHFAIVKAVITLDYQQADILGTLSEEVLVDTQGTEIRELWFFIIPWKEMYISLFVLLLSFGYFLWRARHLKNLISGAKSFQVTKKESLVVLADRYGVAWKAVAKINRIKSPYVLEKGQTILLPTKKHVKKKH